MDRDATKDELEAMRSVVEQKLGERQRAAITQNNNS
jgi:hypothetical protein